MPTVSGDDLERALSPDASRIAHFSRIAIEGDSATELQSKFDTLIHAFEVVQSVDIQGSEDMLKPHHKEELRKDSIGSSLGSAKSLSNAPMSHEGHFQVPPVLS
jgi:aspartyl/glutamyl-tRNA(Asn/Gln) amidotransferase C subunit